MGRTSSFLVALCAALVTWVVLGGGPVRGQQATPPPTGPSRAGMGFYNGGYALRQTVAMEHLSAQMDVLVAAAAANTAAAPTAADSPGRESQLGFFGSHLCIYHDGKWWMVAYSQFDPTLN